VQPEKYRKCCSEEQHFFMPFGKSQYFNVQSPEAVNFLKWWFLSSGNRKDAVRSVHPVLHFTLDFDACRLSKPAGDQTITATKSVI
jgi:hypothetical protein